MIHSSLRIQNSIIFLIIALAFRLSQCDAWLTSSTVTTRGKRSLLSMTVVHKGTVKWFDVTKGYGFITPEEPNAENVFVHQTAIQAEGFRSLAEGESVEYELEHDSIKGRVKAAHVTGPNGSDVQGAPYNPRQDFTRYSD